MRPHLSERLADLRADLTQNPASEEELNLLELVYLDALRAHIQGLTNARLSHLHSAQAEAMAAGRFRGPGRRRVGGARTPRAHPCSD
jgi:hypothetical protein